MRDITVCKSEPYYSIEIQGHHKTYIIEDGWVVHNCGKTAFVQYLANKLGVNLRIINLSTFEEVDMNGIPYVDPDTHELKVSKPACFTGLHDGDIVFFDEVNLAQSGVRNALQTFIQSGLFPWGEQAPHLRIIGAMNVADDLDAVADFSNAMRDRWAYIHFNFPAEEWHKMFKDNFGKPQTDREKEIRKDLSHFLTINKHMLEHRKPVSASTYGVSDAYEAATLEASTPNRRNWDNLAHELATTEDDDALKHYRKDMFIENVGIEAWRNYKEYISTQTKPLSTYKWDGEPDEITQQVNRLKAETDVDKMVEYFVRAHKYCENKEVVAGMLPTVLKAVISKYAIGYRTKYPEFYKIYQEMGA